MKVYRPECCTCVHADYDDYGQFRGCNCDHCVGGKEIEPLVVEVKE